MKLIIFPAVLFLCFSFTFAQLHAPVESDTQESQPYINFLSDDEHDEIEILSDQLAVTRGFIDSEFSENIEIDLGDTPGEINLHTTYLKPLQYTVSNVEGVILDRGRFIGEEELRFSRRSEANYAVFIFAGTRVVRAFLVSRGDEKVAVF
ncbi:MAG: hypothetical protein KDC53_01300 [Saprospiraceae bacterium]|nr:hypothetical protein [Saprospiraceae bacterium]